MALKSLTSWLATRIVAPIIVLVAGAVIVKIVLGDDAPDNRAALAVPDRPERFVPAPEAAKPAVTSLPSSRATGPALTTRVEGLGEVEWAAPYAEAFEFRSADVACGSSFTTITFAVTARPRDDGRSLRADHFGDVLVFDDAGIQIDAVTVLFRKDPRYDARPDWQPGMTGMAEILLPARCDRPLGGSGLGYTARDIARLVVRD